MILFNCALAVSIVEVTDITIYSIKTNGAVRIVQVPYFVHPHNTIIRSSISHVTSWFPNQFIVHVNIGGAQWHSGRVLNLRSRDPWFKEALCCVVEQVYPLLITDSTQETLTKYWFELNINQNTYNSRVTYITHLLTYARNLGWKIKSRSISKRAPFLDTVN